jgi:pimeloyl-ACP methyl ester carboxylesterase
MAIVYARSPNSFVPLVLVLAAALALARCGEDSTDTLGGAIEFAALDGAGQDAEEFNLAPEPHNVLTFEHYVPHVSTVPANAGENVQLYMLERVKENQLQDGRSRDVVIFVGSNTISVSPGADMRLQHYDWMLDLAKRNFDVFMVDLTGYGFSPRPKMDDPCNVDPNQQSIIIPNPLPANCPASYGFRLSTSQSEWDEIDRAVDFVRAKRGVERVNLLGFSRGGWRVASYAARHPEKLEKVILTAPIYAPNEALNPPAVLPQAGFPMTIATKANFLANTWTPGIKCEGQVEDGMLDAFWDNVLSWDPVGRNWGPGVTRTRTFTYWGYPASVAHASTAVPTLIFHGEFDTVAPNTDQLYADLGVQNKIHIHVLCASHMVPLEVQAKHLHSISATRLRTGTVADIDQGKLILNMDGSLTPRL